MRASACCLIIRWGGGVAMKRGNDRWPNKPRWKPQRTRNYWTNFLLVRILVLLCCKNVGHSTQADFSLSSHPHKSLALFRALYSPPPYSPHIVSVIMEVIQSKLQLARWRTELKSVHHMFVYEKRNDVTEVRERNERKTLSTTRGAGWMVRCMDWKWGEGDPIDGTKRIQTMLNGSPQKCGRRLVNLGDSVLRSLLSLTLWLLCTSLHFNKCFKEGTQVYIVQF